MRDPNSDPPLLSASLERLLLRELHATYRQINGLTFGGGLRPAFIDLDDSRTRLGSWKREGRRLTLSRKLVCENRWGAVVEVLKHEMAHQYVDEVLKEHGEAPHGHAFRSVCARFGIDARAAGMPAEAAEGDEPGAPPSKAASKIAERISRLLALATSANVHEAEAAAAAAQRLLLRHNLDLAAIGDRREYATRELGVPKGRAFEPDRIVASILQRHFFVEVIWVPAYRPLDGRRGSVLEISGTPDNLEMAEYVHGFLHAQAARLWEEHRKKEHIKGNRDRLTYAAGVMAGFAEKLAREETKNKSEGLVWIADADLKRYFRVRHPHVRHVHHYGQGRSEAYERGKAAGHGIHLARAVSAGSASGSGSAGRLLPAPRPRGDNL